MITQTQILQALRTILDPDLQQDIVSLGFVKDIQIEAENRVSVVIELTTPACPFKKHLQQEAEQKLQALPGVQSVHVQFTARVRSSDTMQTRLLPQVKHIIVVGSGKGGVGKSMVSANLALSLSQAGARVGLLDADIYGPSIPLLFGINAPEIATQGEKIFPVQKYGISVISMGFFLPQGKAVIWRGPMLDKLLTQFLEDVCWPELDYFIIDLPPGTGDVQLSLCQKLEITGAVIVSTPQEAALNVAQKAIAMFQEVNCPILGIVENMSYYLCPHCNQKEYLFGQGKIEEYTSLHQIPFLGQIPLTSQIRQQSDLGCPILLSHPTGPEAHAFEAIASQVASQISIQQMK